MKKWIVTLFCITAFALTLNAAGKKDGWKLGSQCWTWRSYTFFETVDILDSMGVKYIEVFSTQKLGGGFDGKIGPGMNAEAQKKVLETVKAKGMKIINFGVTAASRKNFEWAKSMGIETIVSEPNEKDIEGIDKLCKEFNIKVAIHNHPKSSHYWNPDTVLRVCEGRSNMIGACADTGHWARSGLKPIDCIKKLKGRIISLHIKDLNEFGVRKAYDVPWGTGVCDLDAVLKELKAQGFKGVFSMEYEKNDADLKENAKKSVEWFRAWPDGENKTDGISCYPTTMTKDIADVWKNTEVTKDNKWSSEKKPATATDKEIEKLKKAALNKKGFSPLFKDDLSNAIVGKGAWMLKDGVLSKKGRGDIWAKKKYGNFILDMEFKCATDTNSGVFLRCRTTGAWWAKSAGIEVQILQQENKNGKHNCGGIFDCLAPKKRAIKKAGEWNHYTIIAKDNRIVVILNGEEVTDMDMNLWTQARKNPDGTPHKYPVIYKNHDRSGLLGFQDHGNPISFRNVMITEL